MNDSKSDFIVFGSSRSLPKCTTNQILIGEGSVSRSPCVKLLGVFCDEHLTFKHHIESKARIAAFSLFNLNKIKRYLDQAALLKMANSLIFSHMDYCNGLFINLPRCTLRPFQRIRNLTAKSILGKSRRDSATESLKQLHILPVHVRCEFKIIVLVYRCLHNQAPAYLSQFNQKFWNEFARRSTHSSQNVRRPLIQRSRSHIVERFAGTHQRGTDPGLF